MMKLVWKSGQSALTNESIHWANPKLRYGGKRILIVERGPTDFIVRYDLMHGQLPMGTEHLFGPFETLEAAKVLCEFLGEPEQ